MRRYMALMPLLALLLILNSTRMTIQSQNRKQPSASKARFSIAIASSMFLNPIRNRYIPFSNILLRQALGLSRMVLLSEFVFLAVPSRRCCSS